MALTTIEPGRSKNSKDIMAEYEGRTPDQTIQNIAITNIPNALETSANDRKNDPKIDDHENHDMFSGGPGTSNHEVKMARAHGNHTGVRVPGEQLSAIARSVNTEEKHDKTYYRMTIMKAVGLEVTAAATEALNTLSLNNQTYQRHAQTFQGANTRLSDAASNYSALVRDPNADPMDIASAENAVLDAEDRASQAMVDMENQEIAVTQQITSSATELANGDERLSEQIVADVQAVANGHTDPSSVSSEAQVILNEIQLSDGTYPTLDGQCSIPALNSNDILGITPSYATPATSHDAPAKIESSYDPSKPFDFNVSAASILGPESVQDQMDRDEYVSANPTSGFDAAVQGLTPANDAVNVTTAPEIERSQAMRGSMERAMNGPSLNDFAA